MDSEKLRGILKTAKDFVDSKNSSAFDFVKNSIGSSNPSDQLLTVLFYLKELDDKVTSLQNLNSVKKVVNESVKEESNGKAEPAKKRGRPKKVKEIANV